ncbi:HK97 gp10 family phage protein [Roseovarius sp. CAU 1744]|uniref:HK97 gp10 family phage protein n=1 Tax=Roseovarius sp. CAU 1744 TaxID=3140368 RepID=UPI00325B86A6
MSQFEKTVRLWSEKAIANLETIAIESTKTVARIAQDRAPEETGVLKDSLHVYVNGGLVGQGRAAYQTAVNNLTLGDTVMVTWEADHARIVEYGGNNRKGHFFVRGAAVQWDAVVAEAIRRAAE